MSHYILNIESATEVCSVCISLDGHVLAQREIVGTDHAARITQLIEACCGEANVPLSALKAVAMSNGPGSYTSLRVGASTAKGLAYALGIPMMAIDTLESLAHAAALRVRDAEALYCPMIDARRMEVYRALYAWEATTESLRRVVDMAPLVVEADSFDAYWAQGQKIYFVGNGAPKCTALLTSEHAHFLELRCAASNLVPLSTKAFANQQFVDIAYHTPEYLKMPNITVPKKAI